MRVNVLAVIVFMVVSGCGPAGPKMYVVTGNVLFQGIPVSTGSLVFYPLDGNGGTQMGEIKDGRYRTQVTAGAKRVAIYAERLTEKLQTIENGLQVPITEQFIPMKFNEQTELTVTVETQSNNLDFDLK